MTVKSALFVLPPPLPIPFATSLSRIRAGVFEKRARAMRCSRDCSVAANQKSYRESVTFFARLLTNQQSCTYRTESFYGISKCFCPIGARFKYPGIFESALYTRLLLRWSCGLRRCCMKHPAAAVGRPTSSVSGTYLWCSPRRPGLHY